MDSVKIIMCVCVFFHLSSFNANPFVVNLNVYSECGIQFVCVSGTTFETCKSEKYVDREREEDTHTHAERVRRMLILSST